MQWGLRAPACARRPASCTDRAGPRSARGLRVPGLGREGLGPGSGVRPALMRGQSLICRSMPRHTRLSPRPAPFVRPRLLLAPDGRGNANLGRPRPPRSITPLQMGRECALHADERGLAAGACRPAARGRSVAAAREGRGGVPSPQRAAGHERAPSGPGAGSALSSFHFSKMGS